MDANAPLAQLRGRIERDFGLALNALTDAQLAQSLKIAGWTDPLRAAATDEWSDDQLATLLDQLPIHESTLFRHPELWTWLGTEIFPPLLRRLGEPRQPLRILSIGCSLGQEAFSAAAILQELLAPGPFPPMGWTNRFQIVGIDPAPAMVRHATSGRINRWSAERSSLPLSKRSFDAQPDGGAWQVNAELLSCCRFEVGTAQECAARGRPFLGQFEIVLFRHVLVYFREATAVTLLKQLVDGLAPGTMIIVAAVEAHLLSEIDGLERLPMVGAARKRSAAVLAPAAPKPTRPVPQAASGAARTARPSSSIPSLLDVEQDAEKRRLSLVERYLGSSMAHAHAGRSMEAIRDARAAGYLDPSGLLPRWLLGRQLLETGDRAQGRALLEGLIKQAKDLPDHMPVPFARGLSAGQLITAARLLLGGTP